MARRATLKDVAGLAGVSTATVARVLHDNGYVHAGTRRLVEGALAETGYQINAIAQGLRRQRTATIGLLLQSVVPNLFFAGVALGVEQEAFRHGCAVLMFNAEGDPERERLGAETLIRRRVDALLFTTPIHEDNVRLASLSGMPVVQVERMTSVDSLAVTADNVAGAYAAVEHLLQYGHRRIAFIGANPATNRAKPGSPTRPNVEQERLSGYFGGLNDRRVPIDDALITLGSYFTGGTDHTQNLGYVGMRRFLDLADPPTALFTTSDLLAAGALQALYECSLRVPEDVSVVGFDDTYAPYFAPPLTTVEQPMVEMGKAAANLVFQSLTQPDGMQGERMVRVPTRLIVRASTGPLVEKGGFKAKRLKTR